jgi:hypothetical protein
MKSYSTYCDQHYSPVAGGALPDTEYLASLGDRLMFRHGSATQSKLALFVAPRGVLHAGWVIGVFDQPFHTLAGEEKAETMKAKSGARFPFTKPSKYEEAIGSDWPQEPESPSHFDPVVDGIPESLMMSRHRLSSRDGNIQNIAKFKPCDICGGHHTPPDAWEPRMEK